MNLAKDEYLLSLLLDGRLPAAEADAVRARLAADPALQQRFQAMERLQALSAGLTPPTAGFDAADVLGRPATAARRNVWWMRAGVAAAAVLLLALSHGSAYLLGAHRGRDATDAPRDVRVTGEDTFTGRADPIANTEALLTRASNLDPDQPYEKLRGKLVGLRRHMRALPPALARWAEDRPPQRARASQLAEALVHLEIAFEEVKDPGFLSIAVASIAKKSLSGEAEMRFVPANAQSFSRIVALTGGRFRVAFVRERDGMPRLISDEGTLEELKQRHDIEFVAGGTK